MKTILFIYFLGVVGCSNIAAQTLISSDKRARSNTVNEAGQSVSPATATLVTAEKNAHVKEVPLEKEANESTTTVPVTLPSAKKPD